MRLTCDGKITKRGEERDCKRFLGEIKGMTVELHCNRCKKVHKYELSDTLTTQDFIALLQGQLGVK